MTHVNKLGPAGIQALEAAPAPRDGQNGTSDIAIMRAKRDIRVPAKAGEGLWMQEAAARRVGARYAGHGRRIGKPADGGLLREEKEGAPTPNLKAAALAGRLEAGHGGRMGSRAMRKDVEAGLALAAGRQRRSDVPRNGKPLTRVWKGGGALLKSSGTDSSGPFRTGRLGWGGADPRLKRRAGLGRAYGPEGRMGRRAEIHPVRAGRTGDMGKPASSRGGGGRKNGSRVRMCRETASH